MTAFRPVPISTIGVPTRTGPLSGEPLTLIMPDIAWITAS